MKNIILLFLFLVPAFLFAQYPTTGNKSRLGWQTTGDGLIWRGVAGDTVNKPNNRNFPYFQLDTVNAVLYRYIATQGNWQAVGGGAVDIDSLIYATRFWVNSNFFPLQGGLLTGTGGSGFVGFPIQSSTPATPATGFSLYAGSTGNNISWMQPDGFFRRLVSPVTGTPRQYQFMARSYTLADSADVAGKLSISDTTSMLLNYPSTVGYGILKNTKTIRVDTTSPNGLATRLFAKTLPTSIVAGRIAVSNGSNLVGYGSLTYTSSLLKLTNPTSTSTIRVEDSGNANIYSNITPTAFNLSRSTDGSAGTSGSFYRVGDQVAGISARSSVLLMSDTRGFLQVGQNGVSIERAASLNTQLTAPSTSSVFDVYSTTQGSRPFPIMSAAQANAITGIQALFAYENGIGPRWYNGTRKAYVPEFTFARGTNGGLHFSDVNGQGTESPNLNFTSPVLRLGQSGGSSGIELYLPEQLVTYGPTTGTSALNVRAKSGSVLNSTIQVGSSNSNNLAYVSGTIIYGSRNTHYDNAHVIVGNQNTVTTPSVGIIHGNGNTVNTNNGLHLIFGNQNTASAYTNGQHADIIIGTANNTNGFYGNGLIGTGLKYYANRQLAFGTNSSNVNFSISDVYFGFGVRNENNSFNSNSGHGPNISINPSQAYAGTDQNGGNLNLNGGIGTSAGTPGDVNIATSTALATGSVYQTLANRLTVKGNSGFVGIKTTSPTQDLHINGDVYITDSLRLTTTPVHTSITGLLTRDANGWVGLGTIGSGLSYSAGTLSSTGTWLKTELEAGRDVDVIGISSTDFRIRNTRIQFDDKFKIGSDSSFLYDPVAKNLQITGTGEFRGNSGILYLGAYGGSFPDPSVYNTGYIYNTNTRFGIFSGMGFSANDDIILHATSTRKVSIRAINDTLPGIGISLSKATFIRERLIIGSDSTFKFDPTLDVPQFNKMGVGNKEAADLSKTQSNYIAGFATDGTVLDLERKRDTAIYIDDTDYDWSAAITTAQIARRYNRVIFWMTTTGAAGSDSELTLHTPDANLMQVEYLIHSVDEPAGFDNKIVFGTNNAVDSTNGLVTNYYPAAGDGIHIRAGLRSGVYKYRYSN